MFTDLLISYSEKSETNKYLINVEYDVIFSTIYSNNMCLLKIIVLILMNKVLQEYTITVRVIYVVN